MGMTALITLVSRNATLDFQLLFQQNLLIKIKKFNQTRTSYFQKTALAILTLIFGLIFFLPTLLIYVTTFSKDIVSTYKIKEIRLATVNDIPTAELGKKFPVSPFYKYDFDYGMDQESFNEDGRSASYLYLLNSLHLPSRPNPTGFWFKVSPPNYTHIFKVIPQDVTPDGTFMEGGLDTFHFGRKPEGNTTQNFFSLNNCVNNDNTNTVDIVSNNTAYLTGYKIRAAKKSSRFCLPNVESNIPIAIASIYKPFDTSIIDDTGTQFRDINPVSVPRGDATVNLKMSSFNINSTHIATAVKKTSYITIYATDVNDITRRLACDNEFNDENSDDLYWNKILCELESLYNEYPMYTSIQATLRTMQNNTATDVVLTRYRDGDNLLAVTADVTTMEVYTIEGGNFYDNEEVLIGDFSDNTYISMDSESYVLPFKTILEDTSPIRGYIYDYGESELDISGMTLLLSRISRNDFSDFSVIKADVAVQPTVKTNFTWYGMVLGLGIPFLLIASFGLKTKDLRELLVNALVPKVNLKFPPVQFGLENTNQEVYENVALSLNIDGNPIVLKE